MPALLLALAEPLLLRVLATLCPEDLLATSRTCRRLLAHGSDGALWRRLYHARWRDGPQQEDAEHVQGSSWLRLYLERDALAVAEARDSAPSAELLPIYVQMATARRSEGLGLADADRLFRSPASSNRSLALASKVDAFRRQRNLTDAAHHASHSCAGKHGSACACSWVQLDSSAWICERSGFVHVCDANCAFREYDPQSEMQLCKISGRCFPAELVTEREEHAGEEERGQTRSGLGQQDEDGWAGDEGVSGRLGRAFVEGYNTQTPADFLLKFGRGI
ncbi:F-box SKIP31 isoform X2 [Micractinium conductrix]|uniref:F-box SKIP31 isoform X2 n=1 Tax=Micractinium conductrix TaxID=554055 RepID=A0A2P6VHA3_9CHLO|nr:F-box SKIP31 isoform X2 [Micractinium conductrix]|eukprot:PSC73457.1 F-box SKIP31 isoform X2 [Micractinium conductrix]